MVVEIAEDEMMNFGKVCGSVIVSVSYCFVVGKILPKGYIRLIALLPIISLFLALPLNLTSVHLCGFTAFLITWLANFKLLLFAFGKPPLSSDPPLSFSHFIAITCFPIRTQNLPKSETSQKKQIPDQETPNRSSHPSAENLKLASEKSVWNFIIKGTLIAVFFQIYDQSEHIPQLIIWIVYVLHIFFELEIVLALFAKSTKFFLGLQLEPQFNEPLLSTSLQDFWGKRWNLMVSSLLRAMVFHPVQDIIFRALGHEFSGQMLAKFVAVMATFLVSAIMHQLMFFYLARMKPTGEVIWFFLLHGACVCLEVISKNWLGKRWQLPRWVSVLVTLAVVLATVCWLFLPPLLRAEVCTRGVQELRMLYNWC